MDFTAFDPSSDAYKMNVIGFFFRTGHNVKNAFKMLKLDFSTITIDEVQNAFLALRLERIPVPINNSIDEKACLLGTDAPIKDKILRMVPGKDLKNMRLTSRGFNDFINAMDLVVNKVLIHLNPSSVQLIISKIGKTDIIKVSEAENGSVVEKNGKTTPSEVLFVEQGIMEFKNVIERRNKKVEKLCIQFESEVDEAEDAHDAHRNVFFRTIGETLSRLHPLLTCNFLDIKVRTPLDLLPIIGNISPENFEKLRISSKIGIDVFFEMRDVVELPQWKQLTFLRCLTSTSLSLVDFAHISYAEISVGSLNIESVVAFIETCLDSTSELSHNILVPIDIAAVAQRLSPLGIQHTIGSNIEGRIPRRSGGYIKYSFSNGSCSWATVSQSFVNI